MILRLASNGLTTWPWRRFGTWSYARTWSVNGSKIKPQTSSMSVDVSILLTFSPKRCGMGHTFRGCGIPSCVASPTVFSSQFWLSIIHSHLLTWLLIKWYPQLRCRWRFLHKILILQPCVPFPYVRLSQPFLTCQVRVVTFYNGSIMLFHQACFEIRYHREMVVFLQVSFPHHECIESTLVGGFSCAIFHGRKNGGCCSTCAWAYLWHSSWNATSMAHVAYPWSTSIA